MLFLVTAGLVLLIFMRAMDQEQQAASRAPWARLSNEVSGDGEIRRGTLACDRTEARSTGLLRRPESAAAGCEAAASSDAVIAGDPGCSEIAGGSLGHTVTITGTLFGEPVNLTIDCYGTAWFELLPLFNSSS